MKSKFSNRLEKALAGLNALAAEGTCSERCMHAMQMLNDLQLDGVSMESRFAIEMLGLEYNALASENVDKLKESNWPLNESDSADMLVRIDDLCQMLRDEEIAVVMDALFDEELPEEAVQVIRKHRDLFAPLLLSEMENYVRMLESPTSKDAHPNDSDGSMEEMDNALAIFALYLFMEWELVEAKPILWRAFRLPRERAYLLFGDAMLEEMPRWIALMMVDELDRVDELIADPKMNMWARWAAADAYRYWVRDGKLSLPVATARLEKLFETVMAQSETPEESWIEAVELPNALLNVLWAIGGIPLMQSHPAEWNWDLIGDFVVSKDEAEACLEAAAAGRATGSLSKLGPTRWPDFLIKLRSWDSYQPKHNSQSQSRSHHRNDEVHVEPATSTERLRRTVQHGRNERCPCGSGKKFKHCCMRKANPG